MEIRRISGTTLERSERPAGTRVISRSPVASLFSIHNPLCLMAVENPHLPQMRRELLETISKYDPQADLKLVQSAIDLANAEHASQVFTDGDPVIYHMCRIGKQLADWKLPAEAVAAGLLLNVRPAVAAGIGDRKVLDLLLKKSVLDSFKFNVNKIGHRKKFMKFALMKESDPLVHLLIAAEEYHTMLKGTEAAAGIAAHAFYVTAPLLTLVGITDAGRELENMAFFHISPDEAKRAKRIFEERTSMDRITALEELKIICAEIENRMLFSGITAQIVPDTKMEASLSKKDVSGEELTDLLRFRILVDTIEECYRAYEIAVSELTGKPGLGFTQVKGDMKDHIAEPKKENGYQSIHDHFRDGSSGYTMALQVRTKAMHFEAEYGRASHWKYKRQSQFGKLPEFMLTPEAIAENILVLRAALAREKRTYAFDQKGDLQRLVQASDKPVTFWDLAVQGDAVNGPLCPEFVEVERVNAAGERVRTKLSRSNQVENGDRLLPIKGYGKKIGNPDNLGTNLAAMIVKQKKLGTKLEATDAAEIEERGEAKCDAACLPTQLELRRLAEEFITLPEMEILFSKERIAKKLGFRSVEDLHYAFALLKGAEQAALVEKASEIMRNSFIALAHDAAAKSVWLLVRARRGVLVSTGKILDQLQVQVAASHLLFLEDRDLALIKFELSEPVKDQKKLKNALRDLYRDVSDIRTTYDQTRHLLLSFNIKGMSPEHIIEAINRVLEAEVAVKRMQIAPVASDRGKALFTLKLPAGRNIEAAIKKLKKLLARNAVFNGVTIHEERELLPG